MAISSRRPSAFTLVELLVVITIIGMLVALLLPAINGARERGRQVTCLNNLKQLGTAAISYDSSRGQLPGYTQFIKRGSLDYATIGYDSTLSKFNVGSQPFAAPPTTVQLNSIAPFAAFGWPTMLLSRLERSDVFDSIVQPPVPQGVVPMPPITVFLCPSDHDAITQADLAAMTYIGNCGAWDRDSGGSFLPSTTQPLLGDTADNGVFFSFVDYERQGLATKAPKMRLSSIKDGTGTTLLFAENIHKSYDSTTSNGAPAFSWLFGNEQQHGFVWVVPVNPSNGSPAPPSPVGNSINDQEALNRDSTSPATYRSDIPRFARPASAHSSGMNVAFCDGHGYFLRDDIDYVVYQQLMTPNGRKCVDPTRSASTAATITAFENRPPLAEKDY
jgi:prepilin-type N-terminal cleavage/methylation domain-containing protein/prepilin-type processing-associated H-X9-DG protein